MARKRRIYKQPEIDKYLAGFSDYLGSKAKFCRDNSISVSTFEYWERTSKKKISDSFLEVHLPPVLPSALIKCGEFSLSNFENIPSGLLAQILSSFAEANRVSASSK